MGTFCCSQTVAVRPESPRAVHIALRNNRSPVPSISLRLVNRLKAVLPPDLYLDSVLPYVFSDSGRIGKSTVCSKIISRTHTHRLEVQFGTKQAFGQYPSYDCEFMRAPPEGVRYSISTMLILSAAEMTTVPQLPATLRALRESPDHPQRCRIR